MSGPDYPPVSELVPHAGDMLLLDRVIEHSEKRTRYRIVIGDDSPYHQNGAVPPWIGVEYLAQAIAAHGGLHARATGAPIRLGLLVGCRRLSIATAGFTSGQVLEASVARVWGERDVFAFSGALIDARDGSTLVQGMFVVERQEPDA